LSVSMMDTTFRAMMSLPPPAAHGTMYCTGREGCHAGNPTVGRSETTNTSPRSGVHLERSLVATSPFFKRPVAWYLAPLSLGYRVLSYQPSSSSNSLGARRATRPRMFCASDILTPLASSPPTGGQRRQQPPVIWVHRSTHGAILAATRVGHPRGTHSAGHAVSRRLGAVLYA
jgi:hypothetical protein